MRSVTACFAILLALVLAFASTTMAVARGANMPVGAITICSDHAVKIVLVDAQGQPTEPAHLCPECGPGLAGFVPDPVALPARDGAVRVQYVARCAAPDPVRLVARSARDPPLA